MHSSPYPVCFERLQTPVAERDLDDLAELLSDTVNDGAAVSFLSPLSRESAREWWRATLESAGRAVVLVARDGDGILGSVQLHPSWAPNQPHRGDVAKLLVHRRARRKGIGARLMRELEDAAREAGLTLLTLDTQRGSAAEHLYRQLGWTSAGALPQYAINADGSGMHDTVIFYKRLD